MIDLNDSKRRTHGPTIKTSEPNKRSKLIESTRSIDRIDSRSNCTSKSERKSSAKPARKQPFLPTETVSRSKPPIILRLRNRSTELFNESEYVNLVNRIHQTESSEQLLSKQFF